MFFFWNQLEDMKSDYGIGWSTITRSKTDGFLPAQKRRRSRLGRHGAGDDAGDAAGAKATVRKPWPLGSLGFALKKGDGMAVYHEGLWFVVFFWWMIQSRKSLQSCFLFFFLDGPGWPLETWCTCDGLGWSITKHRGFIAFRSAESPSIPPLASPDWRG